MLKQILTKRLLVEPCALRRRYILSKGWFNIFGIRATHTHISLGSDIDRPYSKRFNPKLSSQPALCQSCSRNAGTEVSSEVCVDLLRVVPFYFNYGYYCPGCWKVYAEEKRKVELKNSPKKDEIEEKVATMMVKHLTELLPSDSERAPINYAAKKVKSILGKRHGTVPSFPFLTSWIIQSRTLREILRVEKAKKQFTCDKTLVDKVDLELWLSFYWPLWESHQDGWQRAHKSGDH